MNHCNIPSNVQIQKKLCEIFSLPNVDKLCIFAIIKVKLYIEVMIQGTHCAVASSKPTCTGACITIDKIMTSCVIQAWI